MNAKRIVEKYHRAISENDFDTLRSLLADNLDFKGPIATHHEPEGLIADLKGLAQIVLGMDVRKIFVDGQDVCVIYDLKTKVALSSVSEWFHVEGDKINFIRVYFDARPFAALFGK